MGQNTSTHAHRYKVKENIIAAVSVGTVLILLGVVYLLAQPHNLWASIIEFFSSFTVRQFPGSGIQLPAPSVPNASANVVVYNAAFHFALGITILQIVILALRLAWGSPTSKTTETVGNLVFWAGVSYLIPTFLNSSTDISRWFMFWTSVLILIGISLIVRSIILFVKRHR